MKKRILIGMSLVVVILGSVAVFMYSSMMKQMDNTDSTYWEKDILKIESRYKTVEDTDIVFIGSSSIRKWETLEADFSEYQVVNHGFGGSKVADSTYYYDRLVTAFTPKAIVLFAGTNNIHGMTKNTETAEEVLEDVIAFYEKSLEALPGVPVYYISISPTKARWNVWEEANKANLLIGDYADTTESLIFVDVTDDLMKDDGPNKEILLGDGLHLNEEGYKIWTSIIKPIVTEDIE